MAPSDHTPVEVYETTRFIASRPPHVRAMLEELGFATEYYPGYVNRQVRLHSPGIVLLSYLMRGQGTHIIGDLHFTEAGGSLGITHYGQYHDIVTDEAGMDVMNLYVDPARHPLPVLPRDLQRVLPEFLPLHPRLQHRLNRIVRIQFDHPEVVTGLLISLHAEGLQALPGYREAATHYFTLFLLECCRQVVRSGTTLPVEEPSPDARLEALRRYLDQHYTEPHTLASLARRVGVSAVHLSRTFKAYTGMPLFAYLVQRRIQGAMMRLRSSHEPVATVALECGFNDLSYFNRTFKALVGRTPTVYRALFM